MKTFKELMIQINESSDNSSMLSLIKSHGLNHIRSDNKSYRGTHEFHGAPKKVEKLSNTLKNNGWKSHKFSATSGPQQDADGRTYWVGIHKFSHPTLGHIKISGIVTAGKDFSDKSTVKSFGGSLYYKPKNN